MNFTTTVCKPLAARNNLLECQVNTVKLRLRERETVTVSEPRRLGDSERESFIRNYTNIRGLEQRPRTDSVSPRYGQLDIPSVCEREREL